MTWQLSLLLLGSGIGVLLLAGLWTAVALGASGMLVIYLYGGERDLGALGSIAWNLSNSFVLTAVPLFIFMGQMILASGVSEGFFRGVDRWVRPIPGGLLPGSIVANGIFAATTGSSVATAAAVGTVALPEMKRRGYDLGLTAGTLAGAGTLGILIPPSVPLILYAALEGLSVAKLFAAGIVPGVALGLMFIIYVVVRTLVNPSIAGGGERGRLELGPAIRALPAVLPVLALIALVIGTIYRGVATPTEAAALGAMGATVLAAPRLNLRVIRMAITRTIETTVMVMSIMLGAQIATFALVDTGASRELTQWVIDQDLSKYALLAVIAVMYIILGDFIDGVSMMLLTLPLLYPVIVAAGFDPIWFGIVLVIFIELGQITPPVGLNLFVIQGLDPDVTHGQVIKNALPYAVLMLGLVGLLTAFPDIALWLADRTPG